MSSFCEHFTKLPWRGLYFRIIVAIVPGQSGVLGGRCVFALGDRLWQVSPRARSRRRIGELLRSS